MPQCGPIRSQPQNLETDEIHAPAETLPFRFVIAKTAFAGITLRPLSVVSYETAHDAGSQRTMESRIGSTCQREQPIRIERIPGRSCLRPTVAK